jgi:3-dehydroquinate synthase
MPTYFEVRAASGPYSVHIEAGRFDALKSHPREMVVLADMRFVEELTAAGLSVIGLESSEFTKSLERIPEIIAELRRRGANRRTQLVAVGGGIVQDVAGFAASIYMRGLSWTYYPTTLLGMADSCIGGKSSINVGSFKNLAGTFHPPQAVIIDPALTSTIQLDQRVAGLCEAAKICFCRGLQAFDTFMTLSPTVQCDAARLEQVIEQSLKAKVWFIEIDEHDLGERLLLNFGHTFGHAIEATTGFGVSHGVAVGLGMLAAVEYGRSMGRVYDKAGRTAQLTAYVAALLNQIPDIDGHLALMDESALLDAFCADKKHTRGEYALILVSPEERVEQLLIRKEDAVLRRVTEAFRSISTQLQAEAQSESIRARQVA